MSERRPTILTVDDRDIPRRVTVELLRRAGYEVASVASGRAALDAAHAGPDLILLDAHLGDIDGFELCRQLKADPATAAIPVLLTSGADVSAERRIAALDSGADGYLCQPYEPDELLATLRALLRLRRTEQRAQALADALADAVDKRDEFLQVASHELKTPLTTLQLQLDSLHRQLDRGGASPVYAAKVDAALRQTERLAALVDDLLDVSRISAGRLRLDCEETDLGRLVIDVTDRFAAAARRAGCELRVTTADGVRARVDRLRIDQVVANLVANALKYGPGRPIDVDVRALADRRLVTVRDRGIGIAREDRERIFGRFERGVSRRHYGGLGLGLFISRQIVEAHGGTILVDGEPGQGATFTVDLPAVPSTVLVPDQRGVS